MAQAATTLTPAQHLLTDPFTINVSGFVLATDLTARVNGTVTAADHSADVDFTRDFGMNREATRIRADASWRFTPRQQLRFSYFDNDITRSRTIDRDIAWGDYTFQANAQVTAQDKFTIYQLAYDFAVLHAPNYEVVGSVGIHLSDQTLRLSGTATVTPPGGSPSSASYQTTLNSLSVPLPVIGLSGGWAFAPNWYLSGSAQFFKARLDGYDGNWRDVRASVTWMYNNHVGLSAGYDHYASRLDVNRKSFQGEVRYSYSGLLLGITGTF